MILYVYVYVYVYVGAVLDHDEVSLEVAVERVRALRLESKAEDSDDENSVSDEKEDCSENNNMESTLPSNVMVSTQGSRQLMKASDVGTDYYRHREYKGLDPSISAEKLPDTSVVQGQSGLAAGYKYS